MNMRIVFWASISSFVLLFALALLGNVLLEGGVSEQALSENIILDVVSGGLSFVWIVTAVVLWISGIKKLINHWHNRTTATNIVLAIVLLCFNFFAGYYFYLRKEKGGNQV